ncbi:MAG: hypothetical protein JNG86_05360 [Verrucomicrobiaceae bacterium]|nr:hypothetical protein [Verrucomicrobiaceae bacterium]
MLAAAAALKTETQIHFLFVGGGSEFKKVQAFHKDRSLTNITTLPYQPMNELSGSLSSADLHLVVMGDPFVGIVHPCKIYNILSLGIPLLFIGPDQSHGGDLARRLGDPAYARLAQHDEVERVISHIREAAAQGPQKPNPAAKALGGAFSHSILCPRLVAVIEKAGAS